MNPKMPSILIDRDLDLHLASQRALPIKVLISPRQVGKTSLLARLGTHTVVYLDDAITRLRAQEDPRFFLDQLQRQNPGQKNR